MSLGPIEMLVVKFPGNQFTGEIAPALVELVEGGIIRVIDILFVVKEEDGKVTVVDPKWDFVVLDFGSGKGLPQKGVMLVSRNGELVAKVRVMSVQEERSVANVSLFWRAMVWGTGCCRAN